MENQNIYYTIFKWKKKFDIIIVYLDLVGLVSGYKSWKISNNK